MAGNMRKRWSRLGTPEASHPPTHTNHLPDLADYMVHEKRPNFFYLISKLLICFPGGCFKPPNVENFPKKVAQLC